jgi:hypothetical protein
MQQQSAATPSFDLLHEIDSGRETRIERRERARFEYELKEKKIDLYARISTVQARGILHFLQQADIQHTEHASVDHVVRTYVTRLFKESPHHPFAATPFETWWNTVGFGNSHLDYTAKNIQTNKWIDGCIKIPYRTSQKDLLC